jgi:hypothetical protein
MRTYGVTQSAAEKRRVEPDILMAGGDQEAPPWGKPKVGDRGGTPLTQMLYMDRLEEVIIGRELLASPDVPSTGVRRRGVPEAIERPEALSDVEGCTNLLARQRRASLRTVECSDTRPLLELTVIRHVESEPSVAA